MKPHIVIKLYQPIQAGKIPHWESFIHRKENLALNMPSGMGEILSQYGRYWTTQEYACANNIEYNLAERECGFERVYRFIFRDIVSIPRELTEAISELCTVEWVRQGGAVSSVLPSYSQTQSQITEWPAHMLGLPFVHSLSKGRQDIKIAVIDTGIDRDHPELNYIKEKDFVNFDGLDTTGFIGDLQGVDSIAEDSVGHGTHVAGIISSRGNNMPEGVAPGCSLIVVRVLAALVQNGKRVGAGLIDNINAGIKWAVDMGADVINMSLGVRHEHGGLPHEDVVQYAISHGVTVVAASGNDGTNNKYYPGALPGVIAVGAVDQQGNIAPFSSFGARISYLAPGTQILSAFRNGEYAVSSGTSQASPFVSAGIGLLKSYAKDHGKKLNNQHIDYLLKHTSNRVNDQLRDSRGGYGVIHLADAFKLLRHELLLQ